MTLFAFASMEEFSRMFPGLLPLSEQTNRITDKLISFSPNGEIEAKAAVLGVGLLEFATNLSLLLSRKDELGITSVILAGICGAYKNRGLQIGDVVRVDRSVVGDMGVQEQDGSFTPWSRIGGGDVILYEGAPLENAPQWIAGLMGVSDLSVNCCTGTDEQALSRSVLFDCDVESMEGAACFAVCKAFGVPSYQVRAVSNFVGNRDKSQWKIREALEKLRKTISACN